jgi:hypothetical protein
VHGCLSVLSVVFCQVDVCVCLITRPEVSYRVWCVLNDREASYGEPVTRIPAEKPQEKIDSKLNGSGATLQ